MAAKRKVSWEPRARKAEKDLHRMERLRAELSTTLELVTRERDALLVANTELQAVAKAAQETAQTYAHRFREMEDKNVELDAEVDRLKRTDAELREEVRRLRKEEAERREMERRKTPQSQTPPTCRCSDMEERLRALLERVVSLENRMNAVSAAADAGTPF